MINKRDYCSDDADDSEQQYKHHQHQFPQYNSNHNQHHHQQQQHQMQQNSNNRGFSTNSMAPTSANSFQPALYSAQSQHQHCQQSLYNIPCNRIFHQQQQPHHQHQQTPFNRHNNINSNNNSSYINLTDSMLPNNNLNNVHNSFGHSRPVKVAASDEECGQNKRLKYKNSGRSGSNSVNDTTNGNYSSSNSNSNSNNGDCGGSSKRIAIYTDEDGLDIVQSYKIKTSNSSTSQQLQLKLSPDDDIDSDYIGDLLHGDNEGGVEEGISPSSASYSRNSSNSNSNSSSSTCEIDLNCSDLTSKYYESLLMFVRSELNCQKSEKDKILKICKILNDSKSNLEADNRKLSSENEILKRSVRKLYVKNKESDATIDRLKKETLKARQECYLAYNDENKVNAINVQLPSNIFF